MNCTKWVMLMSVVVGLTTSATMAQAEDASKGWLFQRGEMIPVFGPRAEKSRLQKWTSSAQQTLSKTGQRLNPWHKVEVDPIEANRRFFKPDMADNDRAGFFRRWLTTEEEPPKPLTVPDWMALERPGFDRR